MRVFVFGCFSVSLAVDVMAFAVVDTLVLLSVRKFLRLASSEETRVLLSMGGRSLPP